MSFLQDRAPDAGTESTANGSAARIGDWIQTFTGRMFWPLDPKPEEICIEDVAHALSQMCRFMGHTNKFYSVAEHSIRVCWAVRERDALWGLLHDASEAYLVDLPRPLKRHSELGRLYCEAEKTVMAAVCVRFGLPLEEPASVKLADAVLLATEKRDLMKLPPKDWDQPAEPLEHVISPWSPELAENTFLSLFRGYSLLQRMAAER